MDRLEFFALVLNAMGNPGLETLNALSLRFGLEVMGTVVSAACRTSLERPPIGEFVTGCGYIFVIRVYHQQSRNVGSRGLVFPAGPPWRCTVAAQEPLVCGILLTRLSVSGSRLSRTGRLLPGIS